MWVPSCLLSHLCPLNIPFQTFIYIIYVITEKQKQSILRSGSCSKDFLRDITLLTILIDLSTLWKCKLFILPSCWRRKTGQTWLLFIVSDMVHFKMPIWIFNMLLCLFWHLLLSVLWIVNAIYVPNIALFHVLLLSVPAWSGFKRTEKYTLLLFVLYLSYHICV